jgi:hypothetical protein
VAGSPLNSELPVLHSSFAVLSTVNTPNNVTELEKACTKLTVLRHARMAIRLSHSLMCGTERRRYRKNVPIYRAGRIAL